MLPSLLAIHSQHKVSQQSATYTPVATAAKNADTSILLRGTSLPGENNGPSWTDNSAGVNPITPIGNPSMGRESPWAQLGYSVVLKDTGDHLSVVNSGTVTLTGVGAWGLELWWTFEDNDIGYQPLVINSNGIETSGWALTIDENNKLNFKISDNNLSWVTILNTNYTPPIGRPIHLYVYRSSGTIALYADGVRVSVLTISSSLSYTAPQADKLYIGRNPYYSEGDIYARGTVFGLRFRSGVIYTTGVATLNYNKLLTNYTNGSNITFMTAMYNRIYDGSMYKAPIVLGGNPKVIQNSPLPLLNQYYEDLHYSSCNFNGLTDAFTCPSNAANFNILTTAFQINTWVYIKESKADNTIYGDQDADDNNGSVSFFINEDDFLCASWWTTATTKLTQVSSLKVIKNQWNHIYLTRPTANGTNLVFGCNGITATYAGIFIPSVRVGTKPYFGVAGEVRSSNKFFKGTMGWLLMSKTAGIATATYTIPSWTSVNPLAYRLVLRFSRANITDHSTQCSNLRLNNGLTTSTSIKLNNVSSYDLCGNKYISLNTTCKQVPGRKTFTFRTYIYKEQIGDILSYDATSVLFKQYISPTENTIIGTDSAGRLQLIQNGDIVFRTMNPINYNTFTHITIERDYTTIYAYVNGVRLISMDIESTKEIGTYSDLTLIGNDEGVSGQTTYIDDYCLTIGQVETVNETYTPPVSLPYGIEKIAVNDTSHTAVPLSDIYNNTLTVTGTAFTFTNTGDVSIRGTPAITSPRNSVNGLVYTFGTWPTNLPVGGQGTLLYTYNPLIKETFTDNVIITAGKSTINLPITFSCTINIKSFVWNKTYENWIVPQSGEYLVECFGAAGGDNVGYIPGGRGAYILTRMSLSGGHNLVGLAGGHGYNTDWGTGGGGSFLAGGIDHVPIIVAGGGSSATDVAAWGLSGGPGLITNIGVNGNPGARGGAGITGNGGSAGSGLALSFWNGGTNVFTDKSYGFGGGGAGYDFKGGGGGGYTGGALGTGGGSYYTGTVISAVSGGAPYWTNTITGSNGMDHGLIRLGYN
jgi:hypothetical protein